MKKILLATAALAFMATQASAGGPGYVAVYHHVAKTVVAPKASAPAAARHAHHGGHKFICWVNPAGVLVCTVVVLIVGDEVKRTFFEPELPACATMKWRQSWFGKVRDTPRLWRELCGWKATAPGNKVVARG